MVKVTHVTRNPEKDIQQEWLTLPAYIKAKIESTANAIDSDDTEQARERIAELNSFLQEEGIIGRDVRLSTAVPIVSEEILTAEGREVRPVLDGPLMQQTQFEGALSGCSVVQYENVPNHYLAYDIASLAPDGFYYVKGIYDASRIKIHKEIEFDEDETEVIIASSFDVLEAVEDENYAEIVALLRDAFENFDQPMILRLKQLGTNAALLMSHPLHVGKQARVDALHAILSYAIDEDLEYLMKGYEAHDIISIEFGSKPHVEKPKEITRVQYIGITYMTNFDIVSHPDDDIQLQTYAGLQPAIKFFDTAARYERIFPFRFLAKIEEYQYRQDEYDQGISPKIGANGMVLYCGDTIRDFMRRVEAGETQYAEGVLESYQPRV